MTITTERDPWGGLYYTIHTDRAPPRVVLSVESVNDLDRFVCSHRKEPFFMSAKAGETLNEIPLETQWLGIRHTDGTYSVYFSMAFETYRTAFHGEDGQLFITAVTGNDAVSTDAFCAYYKISGSNFYELVAIAARSVRDRFDTCALRTQKQTPAFLNDFGWCTWDSFYDLVKAEDIPKGLESFKKGGIVPKLLILDDGWQTTADQHLSRGQWKLSDFVPNEKFGGNLRETIAQAKAYGAEKFFVWHAVLGYWGGADPQASKMQKYRPYYSKAVHTDGIRKVNPTRWESEHFDFGMIDPNTAAEFYDDYHASLQAQGVDGVKIDVQSAIEGHGSRIVLTKAIRQGMETSAEKHFDGNLINCMSCSNDHIYHCKKSNLMRSSNDFFPDDPLSHSNHIYTNAVNSIWMSQFLWCDWDMFQTGHPYGSYHAASRAISGGPVYVSDRVDEHDFDLIRSLTDREGHLLRCSAVAMPTTDCLFTDPVANNSLYKIFNRNAYNSVVGVFAFGGGMRSIQVSPSDVPGNTEGKYAVYSHKTGKTAVLSWNQTVEVSLERMQWDILTISRIENGVAVIGLTEKLNSGGAVRKVERGSSELLVQVADEGPLLIYTGRDGFQTVPAPACGEVRISI